MALAQHSENLESPAKAAQVASLELRQIQRKLLQAVVTNRTKADVLSVIGNLLIESINPTAIRFFERNAGNELVPTWKFVAAGELLSHQHAPDDLVKLCGTACTQGALHITTFDGGKQYSVSVPVFRRNEPPEAYAVALPTTVHSLERVIMILQLVASHITLWDVLEASQRAESDAEVGAALLEIIAKAESCSDAAQASFSLAGELQQLFKCHQVAIGLTRGRRKRCRLRALSGHATFDRNSELTRAYETALDEAILRGTLARWPAQSGDPRHVLHAQQKLCSYCPADVVISAPLESESGEVIGAWIVLGDEQLDADRIGIIRAASVPISSCLYVMQRFQRSRCITLMMHCWENRKIWQVGAALAATSVLAVILLLPVPYKVKCDCQVEPVSRRFVAAPFDGRLEKALVGPGDVIQKGDILARMEGRDMRWELAGLVADRSQAVKRRDASLAKHDMVEAQLAGLEVERLDLNMKMLEHRANHLEIKSPLDGIVLSGDLEKVEGAPLSIGETLFEVGPLDRMLVEVAVPEEEIQHVRNQLKVTIRLEANPAQEWTGVIAKVHPRTETKDDQSVFVAEVHLDNLAGQLRPGMNGRAKIISDRHPLGWNLFHKPWNFVASKLGW